MPPNTTTQLRIDGLPEQYTPGQAYELTVWVLGVALPGPPLGSALRGFNLEATAGKLERHPDDTTLQTRNSTECDFRRAAGGCGTGNRPPCGVDGTNFCRTVDECYDRRCTTPGTGTCRLCSDTLVNAQATHTAIDDEVGDPAGAYAGDGNSVLYWMLTWTAPARGAGPAAFYLAGNVVNGSGNQDGGDAWSVLNPGITVPEAP
jgi:hypothetical protein